MSTLYLSHSAELYHYGILGMHWGVRRFQPYPKGYGGAGKFLGKVKKEMTKKRTLDGRKYVSTKDAKAKMDRALGGKTAAAIIRDKYGKGGAVRITKNVLKGDNIVKALKKEKVRRVVTEVVSGAAGIALSRFVLAPMLQVGLQQFVYRAGGTIVDKALKKGLSTAMAGQGLGSGMVSNKIMSQAKGPMEYSLYNITDALTPRASTGRKIMNRIDSFLPGDPLDWARRPNVETIGTIASREASKQISSAINKVVKNPEGTARNLLKKFGGLRI